MADGELLKEFLPQPVLHVHLRFETPSKGKRVLKRTTSSYTLFSHNFYVSGNVVQIRAARIKQTACHQREEKISLSTDNFAPTYIAVSSLFYALFLLQNGMDA